MGWPQMWHGLPSALSLALSFRLALPFLFLGSPMSIASQRIVAPA